MYWLLALSLLGTDSADMTRDTGRVPQERVIAAPDGLHGIPPSLAQGIRGIPPNLAQWIRGIPPNRHEGLRGIPPQHA